MIDFNKKETHCPATPPKPKMLVFKSLSVFGIQMGVVYGNNGSCPLPCPLENSISTMTVALPVTVFSKNCEKLKIVPPVVGF